MHDAWRNEQQAQQQLQQDEEEEECNRSYEEREIIQRQLRLEEVTNDVSRQDLVDYEASISNQNPQELSNVNQPPAQPPFQPDVKRHASLQPPPPARGRQKSDNKGQDHLSGTSYTTLLRANEHILSQLPYPSFFCRKTINIYMKCAKVVSLVRSFFLPFPLCLRNFCIFLMIQAHIVWSSKPISINAMPLLLSLPWEQTLIILFSPVQDHIHFGSVVNSIIGFQLCFLFQTKLLHLPSSISMIQINNWITERGIMIIP